MDETRATHQHGEPQMSEGKPRRVLISVPEAAQMLGVCRSKAYELAASGTLPTVRIGRSVRVHRLGLIRWIYEQAGIEPNACSLADAAEQRETR